MELHILAANMLLGMAVVLLIVAGLCYINGRQVLRDGRGHKEIAYLPAHFTMIIAAACLICAGGIYIWG